VLKGKLSKGSKLSFLLRNAIVIFQFAISIILIIGTLTIGRQLAYVQDRDLGFEKDNILVLNLQGSMLEKNEIFKNELLNNPAVRGASLSTERPLWYTSSDVADWEGREENDRPLVDFYMVDYDFIDLYGIQIVKGREFQKNLNDDAKNSYIINETAAARFGWGEPIGKRFGFNKQEGIVIGVMKDFCFSSLTQPIGPFVLFINDNERWPSRYLSVKINPDDVKPTIGFIEKTWNKLSPDYPFAYSFSEDRFEYLLTSGRRFGGIIQAFCVIAVFISCLGLFGLASLRAGQKIKEIGIRKVLGAKIANIYQLMIKEFVFLVCIANAIAWPIAYYIMNQWLQGFAYRINVNIWMLMLSSALAFFIALFTISYQSISAARANPADSLRYE
jgi:ABC-type antimicrobial peptide transport system permease subunit